MPPVVECQQLEGYEQRLEVMSQSRGAYLARSIIATLQLISEAILSQCNYIIDSIRGIVISRTPVKIVISRPFSKMAEGREK